MKLPTLRLSFFRQWPGVEAVARDLHSQLSGKVLWLPAALGRRELEELIDTLAVLLDLPIQVAAEPSRWKAPAGKGALLLVPSAVREPPQPMAGSVVLCLRERQPGSWSLEMPREVLRIREAVIHCMGLQLSPAGLGRLAGWAMGVADTPALAIRFVEGAQACLMENPRADDAALYCAGLATTVGWLLEGVDPRVAQWVLTLALRGLEPERRIGTQAALLGKTEALRRAFESGLVYQVPEREGDPLDLRRPLDKVGRLEEVPGKPSLETLASWLDPVLEPVVREVLKRASRPQVQGLDLPGPKVSSRLVGRDELLKWLAGLLDPSDRIQTCVLYGVAGSGKTTVAATLAQKMAHRLETVWISFAAGPLAGWTRVAAALELDLNQPRAEVKDSAGVPRWVRQVHERLALGAYLIVVDDVDGVRDESLPPWLPAGPGQCAVLVISRSSQRPLQREHDAVALHVPALTLEDARELLSLRVPSLAEDIGQGHADELIEKTGRHPVALSLVADAISNRGIKDTLESLTSAPHEVHVMSRIFRDMFERLSKEEQQMLWAVWVCSPAGARLELLRGISKVDLTLLLAERLVEQGLVVQTRRMMRLHPLARAYLDIEAEADAGTSEDMLLRHASVVSGLMLHALTEGEQGLQADLHQDLLLAAGRASGLARRHRERVVIPCIHMGTCLHKTRQGSRTENLVRAAAAYREALAFLTREGSPEQWADVNFNIGKVLSDLQSADREENLRHAIDFYGKALQVWTRGRNPDAWANVQIHLGAALSELQAGDRGENLAQAIEAYGKASEVWTREHHPEDWARLQNQLGNALRELPTGDRRENLSRAIEAYNKALEVWTREQSPQDWARVQNNLGAVFSESPGGDSGEDLKLSREAYGKALEVWTREQSPLEWAMVHSSLGRTLCNLSAGDKGENLRQALEECGRALEVWTREEDPEDWATAKFNMGLIYTQLPTGNRAENLERAMESYEAALSVFTAKGHPEWHQRVHAALLQAQEELKSV